MDTARYWMAVFAIISVAPAILYWYIVHPFIYVWRKVGKTITFSLLAVMFLGVGYLCWLNRELLLGADLGTVRWLWAPAIVCYGFAAWIQVRIKKHLTFRILAGVPELEADGKGGTLLDEGLYARVRHPRYVAIILGIVAWALFTNYVGMYALIGVSVLALAGIAWMEERELLRRFGQDYADYRRRVPMFIPRLRADGPA
jgi:protein-S-isoprenylcysteine O-methyltransferase Ste14